MPWRLVMHGIHQMHHNCQCGEEFNLTRGLSCQTGRLPSVRHNIIRYLMAKELSIVCPSLDIEPILQSVAETVSGDQVRLAYDTVHSVQYENKNPMDANHLAKHAIRRRIIH
ncbi:hypothetical protein GJ496_000701 [Pomphorhynchus laevis]|nr:hypothetical protein GJ496_000701 [Pomphorhynchus laevis]